MEEVLSSKFYITTPIYYVNDVPHIGHAYTTIIVDTLARFHRMQNEEVWFLTGTDEHGQKIQQSAQKNHKNPKEYVDEIAAKFKNLWDSFGISYDVFIRTTDSYHKESVQNVFAKMFQKGDIYKGEYEGNYCISCESFFAKSQLVNHKNCPDCGKETSLLKEESYFFRLSAYEERLLEWIEANPDCILPRMRRNEVINFIKAGLEDLSITRSNFDWGIRLPSGIEGDDCKFVMYVWLDALMNYLSALGYENSKQNKMEFWPASYHLVGKDILRFHAVYWPAFLMSLELPLPKHIAAHGWWTKEGAKMSKSIGNVVNPKEVVESYGIDCFRYFVLREVPFGQDGDFSQKALIERFNADLGNDLGNLLNRLLGMGAKYFGNSLKVELESYKRSFEAESKEVKEILGSLSKFMEEVQIHRYLEEIWKIFNLGNGIIAKKEPWRLIKEQKEKEVAELLVFVANLLIKGALSLYPCMPDCVQKILNVFGLESNAENYRNFVLEDKVLNEISLSPIPALFPKIEEAPKEVEVSPKVDDKQDLQKLEPLMIENVISKEDFSKVEIKVGTIVEAEILPKSEKLLRLKVDLGESRVRQILAGIKAYYAPQDLIGKQVCVLANLKPAKLMGEISEGMILAAKDEAGVSFIMPQSHRKNGTKIS